MVYEIHTQTSSLKTLKIIPEIARKLYIYECGFCTVRYQWRRTPCVISTHAGVLCTFNNRAASDQASGVVHQGRRRGPSIMYKITPCWVSLIQPTRRAAVRGQSSSLRPHWKYIWMYILYSMYNLCVREISAFKFESFPFCEHSLHGLPTFTMLSLGTDPYPLIPNLCQDFQPITAQNMHLHRVQCVLIIPSLFQAREK